jgi:hypothetical protein
LDFKPGLSPNATVLADSTGKKFGAAGLQTSASAAQPGSLPRGRSRISEDQNPAAISSAPAQKPSSGSALALAPPHPKPKRRRCSTRGLSLWSLLPPFTSDGEMLLLEPFPCGPIERRTGAKPLALVASSPGQGSSERVEDAPAAITERLLPDLLAAAERAKMGDAPKEQEEVLFQCQP